MKGQGTIEYLVILAVIVVISLIVVSLMVSSTTPSQGISSTSSKIASQSSPISILETIVDEDGNYYVKLENKTGERIIVKKLKVGNKEVEYPGTPMNNGSEIAFIINTTVMCTQGENSPTEVEFTYLTSYGLEQIQTYPLPLNFKCDSFETNTSYTDESGETQPQYETGEVGEPPWSCVTLTSGFNSGDGSVGDPYQICNWTQLDNIRNNMNSNFILTLSLSSSDSDYVGIGTDWTPIGDCGAGYCLDGDETEFTGNFNGEGNTISDLVIYKPSTNGVGLFAANSTASTIENLGILDADVNGNGHVGIIIGRQDGTSSKCFTSGNIKGYAAGIGGVAGALRTGTIENSYSTAVLTNGPSSDAYGGIVGLTIAMSGTTITNTYFDGSINSTRIHVGGIVGMLNVGTTVENSYSTGNVTGMNYTGGVIGYYDYGTISDLYWDITTTSQSTCYDGGSTNCTPTNNQESSYYDASGIPFANLSWSTLIWQSAPGEHPTLK